MICGWQVYFWGDTYALTLFVADIGFAALIPFKKFANVRVAFALLPPGFIHSFFVFVKALVDCLFLSDAKSQLPGSFVYMPPSHTLANFLKEICPILIMSPETACLFLIRRERLTRYNLIATLDTYFRERVCHENRTSIYLFLSCFRILLGVPVFDSCLASFSCLFTATPGDFCRSFGLDSLLLRYTPFVGTYRCRIYQ